MRPEEPTMELDWCAEPGCGWERENSVHRAVEDCMGAGNRCHAPWEHHDFVPGGRPWHEEQEEN